MTIGDEIPLSISGLHVAYGGGVNAVRGVDLHVADGGCLAVVGESGSGKTTIGMSVLGLLPRSAEVEGSIRIAGREVVGARESELRAMRGAVLSLVAQDPMRSFNPLRAVGRSVEESWRVHRRRPGRGVVVDELTALGIDNAEVRARARPHEWSGGMLQRAAIAAACALKPRLIVADEPTSALDADRADSILANLRSLGIAVLLISHDLALVGRYSDEVIVMYAGRIVERGPAKRILASPRHPYTRALLAATPRPGMGMPVPLEGSPPRMDRVPGGCAFAPRCPFVEPECHQHLPELIDGVACPVVAS